MMKLNAKTVTREQFAKAMMYTGKLMLTKKPSDSDVKGIRGRTRNFLNQVNKRKDVYVTSADCSDATNLAMSDYKNLNYVLYGRAYFIAGYLLLHPKASKALDIPMEPDYIVTDQNEADIVKNEKALVINLQPRVILTNKKEFKHVMHEIKKGKTLNDITEDLIKAHTPSQAGIPDDDSKEADEASMSWSTEADDNDAYYHHYLTTIKFFSKSKAEARKNFLKYMLIEHHPTESEKYDYKTKAVANPLTDYKVIKLIKAIKADGTKVFSENRIRQATKLSNLQVSVPLHYLTKIRYLKSHVDVLASSTTAPKATIHECSSMKDARKKYSDVQLMDTVYSFE